MHKPKLVLHIGIPKTGTTSLQEGLKNYSKCLRRNKIYFPILFGKSNHLFIAHLLDYWRFPSRLHKNWVSRFAKYDALGFIVRWSLILLSVNILRPHTVIFSSEYLFNRINHSNAKKFRDIMLRYFSDVKIVCYVRKPSSLFASRLSQQLRYSAKIPELRQNPYRLYLFWWENAFPGCVSVRAFDSRYLINNDIVTDFMSVYLHLSTPSHQKPLTLNPRLSADALYALQILRLRICPEHEGRHWIASKCYRYIIKQEAEYNNATKKIKLHDRLSYMLDYCCPDVIWLRDEYGVLFSDIDYEAIAPECPPQSLEPLSGDAVNQYAETDPALVSHLVLSTLQNVFTVRLWTLLANKRLSIKRLLSDIAKQHNLPGI
jgi:hypothetical protein